MLTIRANKPVQRFLFAGTIRRAVKMSPYVAVLKLIKEVNAKGMGLTPDRLRKELLVSFTDQACRNTLTRLETLGYAKKKNTTGWQLTAEGRDAAKSGFFWSPESGAYIVSLFYFDAAQRVMVVDLQPAGKETGRSVVKTTMSLDKLEGKRCDLPQGSVIIENIENDCQILQEASCELTIEAHAKGSEIKWRTDEQGIINTEQKRARAKDIKEMLFGEDYVKERDALRTDYDRAKLDLVRDVKVTSAELFGMNFENINVPDCMLEPRTKSDAYAWYRELLLSKMSGYEPEYFFSEDEFDRYSLDLCAKFPQLKPDETIKYARAKKLASENSNFYACMSLEAPKLLRYRGGL